VLDQNYPNPFNPTTIVSGQLPVPSHVRIAVYDILGREVAVLMDGNKEAGTFKVTWDARGFASGVYICRMTIGNPSIQSGQGITQTTKMVLVK